MLTDDEKRQIESHFAAYLTRRSVAPEALGIVQRRRGWVSDEDVKDVADLLGMTADEVDALATFYSMIFRRPVGRHVILVCDSVSCWVMGYDLLRAHLEKRLGIALGRTTADGRFTLLPVACLGACDHAPAMMVDEDLHLDLTPEKADEVLARYS
jgi:NADH-quinone oxidoreductase subunit E